MDIAVILVIGQYWSCDQGHLFASPPPPFYTHKKAHKKLAQIDQKVLREEHDNIQNFVGRANNFLGPMF